MTRDFHSESLPELSDPELESEEWSLSTSGLVATGVMPVAFCSKSAIRCSSCRIFSASTSSSILFRFSPPVPVPFPRLLLVGGARIGLITKLYSFVSTDAGKESISSSISSLLCLDEELRFDFQIKLINAYILDLRNAFMYYVDHFFQFAAIQFTYGFAKVFLLFKRQHIVLSNRFFALLL